MARSSQGFGIKLSSNLVTVRRNAYTRNAKMLREFSEATVAVAQLAEADTVALCPKDTWWMADHVRLTFTGGNPEAPANFVLGWYKADWANRPGSRHFYPPYVELSQPSLRPAMRKARANLTAAFTRIIRNNGK